MTLVYLGVSWVVGLFAGQRLSLPWFVLPALALLFLLAIFLRRRVTVALGLLCLVAFLGGILRFDSSIESVPGSSLGPYTGREVELKGVVSAEPDARNRNVWLTLSVRELGSGGVWEAASGEVRVWLSRFPENRPGDLLEVKGKLDSSPGSWAVPRASSLRPGVLFMQYPEARFLAHGQRSPLEQALSNLRSSIARVLAAVLPQPQAALAQAVVVGIRSDLPRPLQDAFSQTGTAHLLSISGLHIGIVLGVFLSLGAWLFGRQRPLYLLLAFAFTWLYVLLSGFSAPAVRSGIMGSLFLLGTGLGRQRSSLVALVFAAAVMLGIDPDLMGEVSFQLSFLSMAGLVMVAPTFQRVSGKAPSPLRIPADGLAVTAGALVTTWPLVSYYFGIVSLVALPANLLVLPVLTAVVVFTALSGFLGLVALPLAQGVGWLAWLFLTYIIKVVEAFALLPFSHAGLALSTGAVWGYYLALGAVVLALGWRKRIIGFFARWWFVLREKTAAVPLPFLKWMVPPLLVLVALVWAAALSLPDNRLRVTFLDVGQGDGVLIQSPSHRQVVIDGGPVLSRLELEVGRRLPFWDRTLDVVVLTHLHSDHVAGVIPVLQHYGIGQVMEPDLRKLEDSVLHREATRLILERKIRRSFASAGQTIDLGDGAVLEVLHPKPQLLTGTASDVDNNSLVLRLTYGKVSFLFAADIQEEAEHELVSDRAELRSTVLKVAHHGSDTSTTPGFLAAVDPEVAVISVGAKNEFNHPGSDVLNRLREKVGPGRVYLTSERGSVEVSTDGERLWVKSER